MSSLWNSFERGMDATAQKGELLDLTQRAGAIGLSHCLRHCTLQTCCAKPRFT